MVAIPLVYPVEAALHIQRCGLRLRETVLRKLVGAIGLEPTTPTMSRWCSNQLSYAPKSLFEGVIVAVENTTLTRIEKIASKKLTPARRTHTRHLGHDGQYLLEPA
jgi:hypothetical protein